MTPLNNLHLSVDCQIEESSLALARNRPATHGEPSLLLSSNRFNVKPEETKPAKLITTSHVPLGELERNDVEKKEIEDLLVLD